MHRKTQLVEKQKRWKSNHTINHTMFCCSLLCFGWIVVLTDSCIYPYFSWIGPYSSERVISIPWQNGRNFRRHFQMHSLELYVCISIKISLKFVSTCPIDNMPTLVQIMACHRIDGESLFEPMMALFTDASMRRPQWVSYCSGAIEVTMASIYHIVHFNKPAMSDYF